MVLAPCGFRFSTVLLQFKALKTSANVQRDMQINKYSKKKKKKKKKKKHKYNLVFVSFYTDHKSV